MFLIFFKDLFRDSVHFNDKTKLKINMNILLVYLKGFLRRKRLKYLYLISNMDKNSPDMIFYLNQDIVDVETIICISK